MADWKSRAEILGDVVFFRYVHLGLENTCEEVYVWDLDKTYLDTHWGSLRDLMRTALEKAFQKKNVPGTATLVAALKNSWIEKTGKDRFPIFFITASPPQIESKIKEKLELDQILPYGSFYKDNLKNVKPSRLWRLTQQVGYKLQALLQLRTTLKEDVRQVLWGDDSESDAIIYSLYSDICARRWTESELRHILKNLRVVGEQTETILDLQDQIPSRDPVEKVYINLATDTDPEYYRKFGRRLVPTYNTFQTALDLYQDGRLTTEQVLRVGLDMTMNYGFSFDELEQSFDDLIRRRILGANTVEKILPALAEHDLISFDFESSVTPSREVSREGQRVFELEGEHEPWVAEHIDYLHDYR